MESSPAIASGYQVIWRSSSRSPVLLPARHGSAIPYASLRWLRPSVRPVLSFPHSGYLCRCLPLSLQPASTATLLFWRPSAHFGHSRTGSASLCPSPGWPPFEPPLHSVGRRRSTLSLRPASRHRSAKRPPPSPDLLPDPNRQIRFSCIASPATRPLPGAAFRSSGIRHGHGLCLTPSSFRPHPARPRPTANTERTV